MLNLRFLSLLVHEDITETIIEYERTDFPRPRYIYIYILILVTWEKRPTPSSPQPGNITGDRLQAGCNSVHHHSLGLALHPVLYSAKSVPFQAMAF